MSNYNQQGQGNRPAFKPSILNEFRMRLVGPVLNGAERAAGLTFRVKRNRPVITVMTNLPNDKNRGIIEAELDNPSFEVFLDMLEKAGTLEPGTKQGIKCLDYPFTQGGRSRELKPQAQVIVGREQDGTVFIAVVSWDSTRPVIRFPVRPSLFQQFIKSDGSIMDEPTASLLYAPAWSRVLRNLVFGLLRTEYVHPERRTPAGQGGGGSGGYQQQQQYQQQPQQQQQYQQQQPPASAPPADAAAPATATGGDGWGGDNWPM